MKWLKLLLVGLTVPVMAQQNAAETSDGQEGIVTYPAEFFDRYQAESALDMVRQVPGFTLDDGGNERGFGGAAGNVLINDRRSSTKQNVPSEMLARIPSTLVERIELVRVRIRNIDLQGHTQIVNVVLRENPPAIIRWESYLRQNIGRGFAALGGGAVTDRWKDVDFNVGFRAYRSLSGNPGEIRTFDASGELLEVRDDDHRQSGPNVTGFFKASTWLGDTFLQVNSRVEKEYRDSLLVSTRVPMTGDAEFRVELIENLRRNRRFELGVDAERSLRQDLLGRAILLHSILDQEPVSSQRNLDAGGEQTRFQIQQDDSTNTETIGRFELDWAAFADHAVQLDVELALNVLDNAQTFTDDTGSGPVIVVVPGGNVRIEEDRWNLLLHDTWDLGNLDLDYGLGWERSTIAQSGDSNLERSFTFLKPRAVLTHSPREGRQTQLRLEREVAQLDFSDFVSAAVFEDDDIALGAPELYPDSTWIVEASHERRFGPVALVKLTLFHHWIDDVLDLLPLSSTREAPGNIGDGRRFGTLLEARAPLGWLGLAEAQLGFRARWQDSQVVDPVTGRQRMLSGEGGYNGDMVFLGENKYAFALDFRQDFEDARVSWGWDLLQRSERTRFKANELDTFDEGLVMLAFIETTRYFGINLRLEAQNALDPTHERDRIVFSGPRSRSPVLRREFREGTDGTKVLLLMSGTF